ncbi:MAG: suppressor of fused domain protein [Candidatus Melainabacteria bacterium]|nr:suppressor of fused domain protein [Candidatus Melainabacteria bacterium]
MPKRKSGDEEKPKKPTKKKEATNKSDVSKTPKAHSEKGCDRDQLDAQKLVASNIPEEDEEEPDSRIFRMLQGQRLSPEEARETAVRARKLLIESWHSRDELYRELFGEPAYVTPGPYAPPPVLAEEDVILPEDQKERGETGDPGDPNLDEQHLNVLVYSPDPTRPYWTYVTAGLSSPWLQDSPAEVTGFGCEIMIKSKEDMPWAVQILRTMAFYILNHAGTLSPGVRIDLNGPIIPNSQSKLTNIFIWYPDDAPDCWYYLPSGGFGLFIAIGITPDERQFAESIEEYGTWCIQQVLRQMGHDQVTDPYRPSVMDQEGIGLALLRTKSFADNFRENVAYGSGESFDSSER